MSIFEDLIFKKQLESILLKVEETCGVSSQAMEELSK